MKSDEIRNLFSKFESAASDLEGIECWSARELQELLGYSKWENFEKVIQKAKEACNNAGEEMVYHFPDIRKTIPMPKGAEKEIDDILLTRYAWVVLHFVCLSTLFSHFSFASLSYFIFWLS